MAASVDAAGPPRASVGASANRKTPPAGAWRDWSNESDLVRVTVDEEDWCPAGTTACITTSVRQQKLSPPLYHETARFPRKEATYDADVCSIAGDCRQFKIPYDLNILLSYAGRKKIEDQQDFDQLAITEATCFYLTWQSLSLKSAFFIIEPSVYRVPRVRSPVTCPSVPVRSSP
jgi:hypothetical protein